MSEQAPKPDEEAPANDQVKDNEDQTSDQSNGKSNEQEREQDGKQGSDLWEGIDEDHPVRQVVKDLRSEAAAKRNENKSLQETIEELRERTAEMKSLDEFQQAVAEAQSKAEAAQLEAARERVGRKARLPESLIPRLQGKTAEELEADAQRLRADLGLEEQERRKQGPPKPPVRGGLKPGELPPDEQAIIDQIRSGGRRF